MNIQLQEGTLQIHFRINEDKTVELVNFSHCRILRICHIRQPGRNPASLRPSSHGSFWLCRLPENAPEASMPESMTWAAFPRNGGM